MSKTQPGMRKPGAHKMRPGAKHTTTKTKRLSGSPMMRGGLSKAMKSNRGVNPSIVAHGKKSMRKHGIKI
jgi:hypothetical protein